MPALTAFGQASMPTARWDRSHVVTDSSVMFNCEIMTRRITSAYGDLLDTQFNGLTTALLDHDPIGPEELVVRCGHMMRPCRER